MERQSIGPSGTNPVAEEQFRKGFELAKAGNIDEGILAVEAAIAVSPEEGRYHDLMGSLYAKKGLYEMAITEWKRSIECDPNHAEVFRRIETAEKLKTKVPPRGNRMAWIGLATFAVLFVASLAWGVWRGRLVSELQENLAKSRSELASIEEQYVSKKDYQSVLDMSEELSQKIQSLETTIANKNQEIANLKDESKFVPRELLQKETEAKNLAESDLRIAREEIKKLRVQLESVQDATGATSVQADLEAKDKELALLTENYKTLNDERLRLEKELEVAQERVVNLEAQIDDLHTQLSSSTSSLPVAAVSGELSLQPLLESSLSALMLLQQGDQEAALASLKEIETKHPGVPGLGKAISALSPQESSAPETSGVSPTPTATLAPTHTPTKAPTVAPTPTRKRPKPQPTATPVPKPSGPIVPAKPRPIGKPKAAPVAPVAKSPRANVRQQKPTGTSPAAPSKEALAKRLQQQKATFTQQAYQAYKRRDFRRAKQLIDRAYRIDPKDKAVRQLRGAIERALQE